MYLKAHSELATVVQKYFLLHNKILKNITNIFMKYSRLDKEKMKKKSVVQRYKSTLVELLSLTHF
jgi:hypothetical protein